MSLIDTIFPSASTNAIESGIKVSFIQNVLAVGAVQTKAMPSSAGRVVTFITPLARSSVVSAIWTFSCSPPAKARVPVSSGDGDVDAPPPQAVSPSSASAATTRERRPTPSSSRNRTDGRPVGASRYAPGTDRMRESEMAFRGWKVEALEFFEGLQADNSKAYWQKHKEVY